MKRAHRGWRMRSIAILFSLSSIPNAWPVDELALALQAELSGRLHMALVHYVNALKADEENRELREKVLRLALEIKPPPELPEPALRHQVRGRTALRAATSNDDLLAAADEFAKALATAPWDAASYFNLAVILEKAGRYGEAIANFSWYLLAAPDAEDRGMVQNRIYELQYMQERQERLVGDWYGTWIYSGPVERREHCDDGQHHHQTASAHSFDVLYRFTVSKGEPPGAVSVEFFGPYADTTAALAGKASGAELRASYRNDGDQPGWITTDQILLARNRLLQADLEVTRGETETTVRFTYTGTTKGRMAGKQVECRFDHKAVGALVPAKGK